VNQLVLIADIVSAAKMQKLISPNEYRMAVVLPLIFLAGPIRSAPKWHETATEYLFSKENDLTVISPHRTGGKVIPSKRFQRQRGWERYYIDIAKDHGCVMFWLPEEEKHNCDKVYGAMSRFELGQIFTYYQLDHNTRFCIGSDGKFPELNTIEYDLKLNAPDKKILSSLEETCNEALRIALN
jgi:hypothetical protein